MLNVAGKGRVLVFALVRKAAKSRRTAAAGVPGVNLLPDLSPATLQQIAAQVQAVKQPADVVVASIHWGGNWGYAVPAAHGP